MTSAELMREAIKAEPFCDATFCALVDALREDENLDDGKSLEVAHALAAEARDERRIAVASELLARSPLDRETMRRRIVDHCQLHMCQIVDTVLIAGPRPPHIVKTGAVRGRRWFSECVVAVGAEWVLEFFASIKPPTDKPNVKRKKAPRSR